MADEKPVTIEQLIEKVKQDIQKLKTANKAALLKAIEDGLGGDVQQPSPAATPNVSPLFWVGVIIIPVIAAICVWVFPSFSTSLKANPPPFDLKTQLAFMAFVLAMASYLASVTREIVKKLSEEPKDRDSKINIAWIVVAEMNLIGLGFFTVFRIVLGPNDLPFSSVPLESLLIWHLIIVVLYLMGNHIRIWWRNMPWRIPAQS